MRWVVSRSLTADASSQLDVLWHNSDSLGVNRTQVCIFEESNHVSLAGLLNGEHSLWLPTQITLVLGGDLSDQPLEGKLPNEQLGRLLELADLSQGNCAGSESMRLLDALVRHIGCLTGRLLSQLLARCLWSRVLSCRLLCSCHFQLNFSNWVFTFPFFIS